MMNTMQMHGINIKRSKALEIASAAFGYHNSNEFTAAAKRGDLNANQTEIVDRVDLAGTSLAVIREESGGIYAIEESFLEQVVHETSAESFGPSPYGGLNNIRDAREEDHKRYKVYDQDFNLQKSCETLEEAKETPGIEMTSIILDSKDHAVHEWKNCYRKIDLDRTKSLLLAATLYIKNEKIADLENNIQSLINLSPDWRRWEKDLKKASSRSKGPISDENLYRFRHAVADNHCKSSQRERFSAEYRVTKFMERHLGGLIARLDAAEEALAKNNITVDYANLTTKDAKTVEESVVENMIKEAKPKETSLWSVLAHRDGDICEEIFKQIPSEDPEDTGRKIAAKQFRMDIKDFEDNGSYEDFDSECDFFEVTKVHNPKEFSMIQDVVIEMSRNSYIPFENSSKLKLVAAMRSLEIKPTIEVV